MTSVPGVTVTGTPGSSLGSGATPSTLTPSPTPGPPAPSSSPSPTPSAPQVKDFYGNIVTDPSKPYVVNVTEIPSGFKGSAARTVIDYSSGLETNTPLVYVNNPNTIAGQANSVILGQGTQVKSTVSPDPSILGINYQSQTGNLVNGIITTGGPSVRDLYVKDVLTEAASGFKGNAPNTSTFISNALGQVGLSYNANTKTITDPLVQDLLTEEQTNTLVGGHPGGYAGESSAGPSTPQSILLGSSLGQAGLGYVSDTYSKAQINSLISSVISNPEYGGDQNFLVSNIGTSNSIGSLAGLNLSQSRSTDQNLPLLGGPMTPLAEKLGSNLGQVALGQLVRDSQNELATKISEANKASLLNPETPTYGGIVSLQTPAIPRSYSVTLAESLGISDSISGSSSFSKLGLIDPNAKPINLNSLSDVLNLKTEQDNQLIQEENNITKINNAIDNLTFQNDLINEIKSSGTDKVTISQVQDLSQNGLGLIKTSPLETISAKDFENNLNAIISQYSGKELSFSFNPISDVNSIGAGLDVDTSNIFTSIIANPIAALNQIKTQQEFENWPLQSTLPQNASPIVKGLEYVNNLFNTDNPLSGLLKSGINSASGIIELIPSLPINFAKEVYSVVSGGNKSDLFSGKNALISVSPEIESSLGKALPSFPEVDLITPGITSLLSGGGLSGFKSGIGTLTDIGSLASLFVGTEALLGKLIPLRYTTVTLEKAAGLSESRTLGSALTLGYKEGGSGNIIFFKAGNNPLLKSTITLGTPAPESYFPLDLIPEGRGFTRAEGGALFNKLVNSDQVLQFQLENNILNEEDIQVIKATRDATNSILKSPVKIYHPEFGDQPLGDILSNSESENLKDFLKQAQSKLDLGPTSGSFADIPFVPGNTNVGDLDVGVKSLTHREQVGKLAEEIMNGNGLPGRTFEYVPSNNTIGAGVYLIDTGEQLTHDVPGAGVPGIAGPNIEILSTGVPDVNLSNLGINSDLINLKRIINKPQKIIDLPIKGLDEEGGALGNSSKINMVFGKPEPKETFMIEGIEIMTPHYNTIRRSTTLTRMGGPTIKTPLESRGSTTKFGNYTGPEKGRLKDAARYYRGVLLDAKAFRERGSFGDIGHAEQLEFAALTVKNAFEREFDFSQALKEIRGEAIINTPIEEEGILPKEIVNSTPLISILKLDQVNDNESNNSLLNKSSRSLESIRNSNEKLVSKYTESQEKSSSSENRSRETLQSHIPSLIKTSSISKSITTRPRKSQSPSYNLPSRSINKSSIQRTFKNPNSVLNSKSPNSKSPNSKSPNSKSSSPKSSSSIASSKIPNTFTFKKSFTLPSVNSNLDVLNSSTEKEPPLILDLPDIHKKFPRIAKDLKERNNFIGNTSEIQIEGIYNRSEITYGNNKITKLVSKDISMGIRKSKQKTNNSFLNKRYKGKL